MATDDEGLRFPPLRSLNDFLMDARWSAPQLSDIGKVNHRVMNNLLYYQTNYFLLGFVVFICVGFQRPHDFIFGLACLVILGMLFVYYSKNNMPLSQLTRERPLVIAGCIMMITLLICYTIGYILIFILGILLPISCIFCHALFRMRNIANKVTNRLEQIGLTSTPMGVFLDGLGVTRKMIE